MRQVLRLWKPKLFIFSVILSRFCVAWAADPRTEADLAFVPDAAFLRQGGLQVSTRFLDLDGFSKNGDIQFLTRFGGRITPRYSIERASMKYRLVKKITQLR